MSDITSLIGGFILTYISLQLRSDSTEIVLYVPNNLAIHGEFCILVLAHFHTFFNILLTSQYPNLLFVVSFEYHLIMKFSIIFLFNPNKNII